MKKAFIVIMVIAFSLVSSMAFAASITQATTLGLIPYSPSAKVGVSAASANLSYCAASCHVSGSFQYGTCGGSGITGTYNDTAKIYKGTIPTQDANATVCAPTSQTSATSLSGTFQ